MGTIIAWTNEVWNPITGCSKASAGCLNCYAERLSLMRGWSDHEWSRANAQRNVRLRPERLNAPRRYKPGTRCFVNSMSDMFHEHVPDEYLHRIMDVIESRHDVTFQCLTKRSKRLRTWERWPANLWMGVSIEDERVIHRADDLRHTEAAIRFVSAEPLIGPLTGLSLSGIDWLIIGGESGPKYRPMQMEWVWELRDMARSEGVAVFFKQDAAPRTEARPYIVERDGTHSIVQEYPDVRPKATRRDP